MPSDLSRIGSPEADHADALISLGEAQDVETISHITHGDDPYLTILSTLIDGKQRRSKVKICDALER
jgi:major membrane immunogen (membrane-anchored lipoprotein)